MEVTTALRASVPLVLRDDGRPQRAAPAVRKDSPVYGCPRLKEVIVDAALKGEITLQDAEDLFVEYGLKGA